MDYKSPEFYHFSEDSIILSKIVITEIKNNFKNRRMIRLLDLCSGCGVIGIEIMRAFENGPHNISCDFVEIQKEYEPFYQENVHAFLKKREDTKFIVESFESFKAEGDKYDLIVSNPPYYGVNSGRKSNSLNRNICKFFLNGTESSLLHCMSVNIKRDGKFFFLSINNLEYFQNKLYSELLGSYEQKISRNKYIITIV